MEELIEQIIGIEEKAQEIVSDARAARTELTERVALDTIKMQKDIEAKAREKSENIKQMESDEVKQRLDGIKAKTEKSLASLEEMYSQNKDKWIESIVSGVIGGSNE